MPMMLAGIGAFLGLVSVALVLQVKRKISEAFAFGLCVLGLVCLWVFPTAGSGFRGDLPGVKLETLAERAEQAASEAVASKEEVQRLAATVAETGEQIRTMQRQLLLHEEELTRTELAQALQTCSS